MNKPFKLACAVILAVSLLVAPLSAAEKKGTVNLRGFDAFVNRVIQEWQLPGVAVVLVKDGRVLLAKGYGWRDVDKQLPVTGDTLFAIGSCSKAFTATAVGMLVDEGKIAWKDPVRNTLQDFRLKDPVATEQMTPVDLMCHRSGLPRHDFAWYGSDASRSELYRRLRHLEPTEPFRAAFQYNNFMFMTAGILVERLSGKSWEAFIAERIFKPLGMDSSNFSVEKMKTSADASLAYTLREEKVTPIPYRNIDAIGPAGAINSSAADMAKWVQLNLNHGKWGEKELIKENTLNFIQTPQMTTGAALGQEAEFLYSTYGLGWALASYRGAPVINHGGGIDGFISVVSLLPRQNAGLVVLTNCDSVGGYLTSIIGRNLCDRILGMKPIDWNRKLREERKKNLEEAEKAQQKKGEDRVQGTTPSHEPAAYCGRYRHPGYGILEITQDGEALKARYNGNDFKVEHFHYDIFDMKPMEDEDRIYKISFITDAQGAVSRVEVPFQTGVADIRFTRLADEKLRDPAYLKRFAGEYALEDNPETGVVSLAGDHLILEVGPQGPFELVPYREAEFTIRNLTGFSVKFVQDASGTVTGLEFHQPNGVFQAKKIK